MCKLRIFTIESKSIELKYDIKYPNKNDEKAMFFITLYINSNERGFMRSYGLIEAYYFTNLIFTYSLTITNYIFTFMILIL